MKCAKCSVCLPENGDYVNCSVCDKKYDYNCSVRETKWRNMSAEAKSKWACADCKGPTGVSRVNSLNSVSSDVDTGAEEEVSVKALLLRINSRLNTLDDVKVSMETMSKSMSFLSDKYDELLKEVRNYKRDNNELKKTVEGLKSECMEKDKAFKALSRRFNVMEQYGRAVNLEIHGLPRESHDEKAEDVLKKVAATIQQPFNISEVQAAHRLPSRKNDRPPIFLVQFVNKATKQRWLAAGRRMKLCAKDIVGKGDNRIFFNENLTPYFNKLFYEARALAKGKGYESTWVMNGTIRVRKNRDARPIVIADFQDLELIV